MAVMMVVEMVEKLVDQMEDMKFGLMVISRVDEMADLMVG
jgi:hypothetical protein